MKLINEILLSVSLLTASVFAGYYIEGKGANIEDGKCDITYSSADPKESKFQEPQKWVYYLFLKSNKKAKPQDVLLGSSRPFGCIISKNFDDAKRRLENFISLENAYGYNTNFTSSNNVGPVAVYYTNTGDNGAYDDKTIKDALRLNDTLEKVSEVYDTINQLVTKNGKIQELSFDEYCRNFIILNKSLMRINTYFKNPQNTDINSDTLKNIYYVTKKAADSYRKLIPMYSFDESNQSWTKAQIVNAANPGFAKEKDIQAVSTAGKNIKVIRVLDECKNTYTMPKKNIESVSITQNDTDSWKVTVFYNDRCVGVSYFCSNKPQVLSNTASVDMFFKNKNDAKLAQYYFDNIEKH